MIEQDLADHGFSLWRRLDEPVAAEWISCHSRSNRSLTR
jgi:hypothetical protein